DRPHLPRGQVGKSESASAKSADDGSVPPGKVPHTALSSDVSGDDSAHPFKTNLDHHASAVSDISSAAENRTRQHAADDSRHTREQPDDNGSPAETDGAHLPRGQVDKSESASAKFTDDGSALPGKVPHVTALSSEVSGDDSAHPFKTNLDHHASADPDIS